MRLAAGQAARLAVPLNVGYTAASFGKRSGGALALSLGSGARHVMSAVIASCYLALGSNLGERWEALNQAVAFLAGHGACRLVAGSTCYETPPVGPPGQAPYLNAVVKVETALSPEALLRTLKGYEQAAGRHTVQRWGPRPIDLDILLYGERQVREEGLIVPHAELSNRAFVLVPLHELAPLLSIPGLGLSVEQCLLRQADRATIIPVGRWRGLSAPGWEPLPVFACQPSAYLSQEELM